RRKPRPAVQPCRDRGFRRSCGGSARDVHAPFQSSAMLRRSTATGFPMLLYQMHELGRAWMAPLTYWAEANARMFSARDSWLSALPGAARLAAGNELLYRIGKDYEKPEFGIHAVKVSGHDVPVVEKVVA